jgi:hypothetical protein
MNEPQTIDFIVIEKNTGSRKVESRSQNGKEIKPTNTEQIIEADFTNTKR